MVQSTAEAEYISAAAAANHAIWLRKILSELNMIQLKPTKIYVDNKSAIVIANNSMQHGGTKHIKVKFHFLREAEKVQEIHLEHCRSDDQRADILTKALPNGRFEDLRAKPGVFKRKLKEERQQLSFPLNITRDLIVAKSQPLLLWFSFVLGKKFVLIKLSFHIYTLYIWKANKLLNLFFLSNYFTYCFNVFR